MSIDNYNVVFDRFRNLIGVEPSDNIVCCFIANDIEYDGETIVKWTPVIVVSIGVESNNEFVLGLRTLETGFVFTLHSKSLEGLLKFVDYSYELSMLYHQFICAEEDSKCIIDSKRNDLKFTHKDYVSVVINFLPCVILILDLLLSAINSHLLLSKTIYCLLTIITIINFFFILKRHLFRKTVQYDIDNEVNRMEVIRADYKTLLHDNDKLLQHISNMFLRDNY